MGEKVNLLQIHFMTLRLSERTVSPKSLINLRFKLFAESNEYSKSFHTTNLGHPERNVLTFQVEFLKASGGIRVSSLVTNVSSYCLGH